MEMREQRSAAEAKWLGLVDKANTLLLAGRGAGQKEG
jgi:hypothetical protein